MNERTTEAEPHPQVEGDAVATDELGGQGIFPMRVAVQLTGLSSDTIRAWERRYHAIEPVRSAGNTRKFTQDDIRRLLLLREATESGHSIGNIADLDNESLRALKRVTNTPQDAPRAVTIAEPMVVYRAETFAPGFEAPTLSHYFELLGHYDLARAAAWLRRMAALLEPRTFVLEVVAPALSEIRERRADARLGGPHLIAAWQQLTAVLHVLLETAAAPQAGPVVVAVGASRQRHAIAAMASTLLAREHGLRAAYLGPTMPDADILWAADALEADLVVVDASVPTSPESIPGALATFERMASRTRVWLLTPSEAAAGSRAQVMADLLAVDRAFALRPLARKEPP